jgi:hypothetical protein
MNKSELAQLLADYDGTPVQTRAILAELDDIYRVFRQELNQVKDEEALKQLRITHLGKSSKLALILSQLGRLTKIEMNFML